MYLNFSQVGGHSLYLYYPVILIGTSVALLFNPLKMFHFRTRMWLLYSLVSRSAGSNELHTDQPSVALVARRCLSCRVARLLSRGYVLLSNLHHGGQFYLPSLLLLTDVPKNIATLFCLYSRGWNNPGSCNSSHLRVVGFLTALPGIWRALQCLRRYADTGNKFPHLLNFGKYMATIMFYACLSIYRMDQKPSTKAAFITFGTINGFYTSFWDIYYDWSLGDPHAKHPFLRKELGYKKIWWYYTAIAIDPILRFNWVLYTVIPLQLQHSAVTSFGVSLSEIFRRGMWSLFRVENEHCTNVGRFRASRDVPLPYEIPPSPTVGNRETQIQRGEIVDEEQPAQKRSSAPPTASASGAQLQLQRTRSSVHQRRGLPDEFRPSPLQRAITHVGDMFRDAHAEDFERKRKPELGRDPRDTKLEEEESDDESDDDDRQGDGESGNDSGEAERDSDGEVEDDEEESALSRIREDLEVGMSGARSASLRTGD
jgi:hypothetical protein